MKKLVTSILVLISIVGYSQGGTFNAQGKFVSGNNDSAVTVGQQISLTSDTTKKFGFAKINGVVYYYDGYWKAFSSGGSSQNLQQVLTNGNVSSLSGAVRGWQVGNYNSTVWGDTLFHMGNSLTFGVGSTGGQTYPEQLKGLTGKPYYNLGIGGTKLVQATIGDSSCIDRLYRIPLRNTIGAYVLEYTTNDVFANQSITNIRNAWLKTIAYMIGNNIDSRKVILLGNTRDYRYQTNQTLAYSTDTCLRNVCKETGISYISLRDLIINNGGLSILTSDSLHLNNTGYSIMAAAIYQKLPFVTSDTSKLKISGNAGIDSNLIVGKSVVSAGVNTNSLLVSQSANIQNSLKVDSVTTRRVVLDTLNLNAGGKILFNGTGAGNKILQYDGGDPTQRIGSGYNTGNSHSIFSFGSLPILFGMNNDANTMNTSNAAFYINANNQLNWRNSVAGTLSWGASLVASRNNILFYDGGSTSSRYGIGVSSSKLTFYTALSDTMAFGGGTDGSNTFGASSAFYVQNNKVNFNNILGTMNWGTTIPASRNYLLFYDGGSTSSRYGLGFIGGVTSMFSQDKVMIGSGVDASNISTSNATLWGDNNNILNIRLAPKVLAFNTAGVVVNDASGNLSTSTAYATTSSPTFTGVTTVAKLQGSGIATVALGSNAATALGSSGTVSISGNDVAGTVSLATSGTVTTVGNVADVSFSSAYTSGAKGISLTNSGSDLPAGASWNVTNETTTGFTIRLTGVMLSTSQSYSVKYIVIH
jgi:GDSL-like Lipase/Acylhydrolase family